MDRITDTPMPHSVKMEQAVLGCMLIGVSEAKAVMTKLDSVWFYVDKHQVIYKILAAKIEGGIQALDLPLACQWLTDAGVLGEVGGMVYLTDCLEQMSTAAHNEQYISEIRKLYLERQICRAVCTVNAEPSPENIEALRQASQDRDCATVNGIISVQDCYATVEEMMQPRTKGLYEVFNSEELDKYHNGMTPGNILTIAARPGVGKTVISTHIGLHFAQKYNEPVLYFSTEMPHEETLMRILAPMSGVPGWKWRKRFFTQEDKLQIAATYKEFLKLPFYMNDKPSPTMADIRAGMVQTKCKLVIIDYIQRLNVEEGRDGLPAALGRTMKSIKDTARGLGCMAVVLSQMDRETDHLTGRARPQLADLKGSGDIEQESDAVMLMWKHNKNKKGSKEKMVPDIDMIRPIELIHAKNRHGTSDVSTQLIFDEKFIAFREWNEAEKKKYLGEQVRKSTQPEKKNDESRGWTVPKPGESTPDPDNGSDSEPM